MTKYKPVPVSAAADMARDHDKSIIVVIALDDKHNLMHVTTYAVDPTKRELAAAMGVIAAGAIGADLEKATHYQKLPKDDDKV